MDFHPSQPDFSVIITINRSNQCFADLSNPIHPLQIYPITTQKNDRQFFLAWIKFWNCLYIMGVFPQEGSH